MSGQSRTKRLSDPMYSTESNARARQRHWPRLESIESDSIEVLPSGTVRSTDEITLLNDGTRHQ